MGLRERKRWMRDLRVEVGVGDGEKKKEREKLDFDCVW